MEAFTCLPSSIAIHSITLAILNLINHLLIFQTATSVRSVLITAIAMQHVPILMDHLLVLVILDTLEMECNVQVGRK